MEDEELGGTSEEGGDEDTLGLLSANKEAEDRETPSDTSISRVGNTQQEGGYPPLSQSGFHFSHRKRRRRKPCAGILLPT